MVKIRLRRMGTRNAPFYRVVVADSRRAATGKSIEEVGYYDPVKQPVDMRLDTERIQYWVDRGAQLSPTVKSLLTRA